MQDVPEKQKMMQNRRTIFSEYDKGSELFKRSLLRMAPGYILSSLSTIVILSVDSIFVGNVMGKEGLAAIGYVAALVNIVSALSAFYVGGIAPSLSQVIGSGDAERLKRYKRAIAIVILQAAAIFSIVQIPLYFLCTNLLGVSGAVRPEMNAYAVGLLIMTPFSIISTATGNIFVTMGKAKTILFLSVVEGGLNLVLDLLMLVVFKTGIWGVGLASLTACFVRCLCSVVILFRKLGIRIEKQPCKTEVKELISCGTQYGLTYLLTAVQGYVFVYVLTALLGDEGMAVNRIAEQGGVVISMIIQGILNCSTSFIGLKRGMGNIRGVYKSMKTLTIVILTTCGIICAVFMIRPQLLFAVFGQYDVTAFECAVIRICTANQFLCGFFAILFNYLVIYEKNTILRVQQITCELCLWSVLTLIVYLTSAKLWIFAVNLIVTIIEIVWMYYNYRKQHLADKEIIKNSLCLFASTTKEQAMSLNADLEKYLAQYDIPENLRVKLGLCVEETACYMESPSVLFDAVAEITVMINGDSAVFSALDDSREMNIEQTGIDRNDYFSNIDMLRSIAGEIQVRRVMDLNCLVIHI